MSCPARQTCPRCAAPMVHQDRRGRHESVSLYGQHIHDNYPQDFDWVDQDFATHKRECDHLFRHVEVKRRDETVHPSQWNVLPLYAEAIHHLVLTRRVHQSSGVFVVFSDPPFTSGEVWKFRPGVGVSIKREMHGEEFERFKTGLPIGGPSSLKEAA